MAKKLHDSNTPPDICHLFNENRTFYFESDISAIPNPPCTLPAPTTATAPRLHKSMSQPVLSVTRTVTSLNGENMHAAVYCMSQSGPCSITSLNGENTLCIVSMSQSVRCTVTSLNGENAMCIVSGLGLMLTLRH